MRRSFSLLLFSCSFLPSFSVSLFLYLSISFSPSLYMLPCPPWQFSINIRLPFLFLILSLLVYTDSYVLLQSAPQYQRRQRLRQSLVFLSRFFFKTKKTDPRLKRQIKKRPSQAVVSLEKVCYQNQTFVDCRIHACKNLSIFGGVSPATRWGTV